MPRPLPQPPALALIVADFISQLRIAQRRQTVRRNKLSLTRRKSLSIPSNATLPLIRRFPRLVDRRRKRPLQISLRSRQRLPQVNLFSLLSRKSNPLPVPSYIFSSDPSRFPIPRLYQSGRSRVFSFVSHRLHRIRIRILIFLLTLIRRIRKFFSRRLPRCLRRIILRRTALRRVAL